MSSAHSGLEEIDSDSVVRVQANDEGLRQYSCFLGEESRDRLRRN